MRLFSLFVVSLCLVLVTPESGWGENAGPVQLRGASFAGLHRKALRGGDVRILFLGGSITQNTQGHSAIVPQWIQRRYPQANVEGINGGLSSTCSNAGAFRFASLIRKHAPIDLLVVEFAVNDDQDAGHDLASAIRGMEGVVRRAKREGMDVLMVQYVNPPLLESVQTGEPATALRAHRLVADRYGVPTADIVVALAESIKQGGMDWKQYGGVHPNAAGYEFASRVITDALASLLSAPSQEAAPLPEPLDAGSYSAGRWVSPGEARFTGEWLHGHPSRELIPKGAIREQYAAYPLARSGQPGSALELEFEGTAVGAFVLAGPDAGQLGVSIDGGPVREIELYHRYSRGLNYPRMVMFADGLKPGRHRVSLTLLETHHPQSVGSAINLLYFGVHLP